MSNQDNNEEIISLSLKDLKRVAFILGAATYLTESPDLENADKFKEALFDNYPDADNASDHMEAVSEIMGFDIHAFQPFEDNSVSELLTHIEDTEDSIVRGVLAVKIGDLSDNEDQRMGH